MFGNIGALGPYICTHKHFDLFIGKNENQDKLANLIQKDERSIEIAFTLKG
jgi:hypothetical protein